MPRNLKTEAMRRSAFQYRGVMERMLGGQVEIPRDPRRREMA